ncbi:MAG TPA: class I SAM-dependent methyltransferase [Anaerolineales bacterium]|nr:class I SAM-dependent methyltransferase [Anaerolineales bacterium]
MRPAVRDELLRINRAFYQSLAGPFATTRRRLQPGVRGVLERVAPSETVLDVGCGHGLAAEALIRRGHRGFYLGIDASPALIEMARRRAAANWVQFAVVDVAHPGWLTGLVDVPVDWLLAFAVLHHLPDAALRERVVGEMRSAIRPGARAAVSVWDFAGSERFQRRVVGWESIGLAAADVEPGDYLLDWREGGTGVRYVHHFSPEELADLANSADFEVVSQFHSDGEGGNLGLYQVWAS